MVPYLLSLSIRNIANRSSNFLFRSASMKNNHKVKHHTVCNTIDMIGSRQIDLEAVIHVTAIKGEQGSESSILHVDYLCLMLRDMQCDVHCEAPRGTARL